MFESRLKGSTIRISIGTLADWPVKKARTIAQELKMLIDAGIDPREVERDRQAAATDKKAATAAKVEASKVAALTVGEVWSAYIAERRSFWGDCTTATIATRQRLGACRLTAVAVASNLQNRGRWPH